MRVMARDAVLQRIEKEVGLPLDFRHPFTGHYPPMVVLYTNYNLRKQVRVIERVTGLRIKAHVEKLSRIMAEPGKETKQTLWWYACENPIVRPTSLSMRSCLIMPFRRAPQLRSCSPRSSFPGTRRLKAFFQSSRARMSITSRLFSATPTLLFDP